MNSYLCILEDSLGKKLELLKKIEEKSLEQSVMIKANKIEPDLLDQNMDEKLKMIQEINTLVNWSQLHRQAVRNCLSSLFQ